VIVAAFSTTIGAWRSTPGVGRHRSQRQSLLERTSKMDLVAKLPAMEDDALAVLHENAERLEQTGTKAQSSAAAALMPALEAELASRRAAKLAAATAKRTAATKRSATTKRATAKSATKAQA
jgi:hypothetical protein